MAQHFLLSARARTLSLREIYQSGEDAAYATFCKLRWPVSTPEIFCSSGPVQKCIAGASKKAPRYRGAFLLSRVSLEGWRPAAAAGFGVSDACCGQVGCSLCISSLWAIYACANQANQKS